MNKPIDNEAVHKKKWPIKSGLKARDITNIVTASIYKESRRIPQDPAESRRIPQMKRDQWHTKDKVKWSVIIKGFSKLERIIPNPL